MASYFTVMVVVGLLFEVPSSSEVPQLHRLAKLIVQQARPNQPQHGSLLLRLVESGLQDYEIGSKWQIAVHIVRKPVAQCISDIVAILNTFILLNQDTVILFLLIC